MSRIKEPNFFSRTVIGESHPMVKPIRDEADYLRLFNAAGSATVLGEATPFYLADSEAPSLIRDKSPDARAIASLRDPVERLYSHYLMMRNNLPSMGSFMEEIERGFLHRGNRDLAILDPELGLYSHQVERYQRTFGDRFKVLVLEEWSHDPARTLRSISEFLGLGPVVIAPPTPAQRRYAAARGPLVRFLFGNRQLSRAAEALIPFRLRKYIRNAMLVKVAPRPAMDAQARAILTEYYREDVRRTERLLGRTLPWPNFAVQPASSSRSSSQVDRRPFSTAPNQSDVVMAASSAATIARTK
jgi:hypothetical protein